MHETKIGRKFGRHRQLNAKRNARPSRDVRTLHREEFRAAAVALARSLSSTVASGKLPRVITRRRTGTTAAILVVPAREESAHVSGILEAGRIRSVSLITPCARASERTRAASVLGTWTLAVRRLRTRSRRQSDSVTLPEERSPIYIEITLHGGVDFIAGYGAGIFNSQLRHIFRPRARVCVCNRAQCVCVCKAPSVSGP